MEKKLAFYLRLSIADGDLGKETKEESNSIESQRLLLADYLREQEDLHGEVCEYVDDGYTGMNFERPAFQRMLADCKNGQIGTILVKDLSRLGRDYICVGDYVEQIFPALGIRFIAVNNRFDSMETDGAPVSLDVAISNLINSFYSRDLSGKIRTSFETRWKQGRATSANVPFGYLWDSQRKGEWIIDPVASVYVRRLFDLAREGYSTSRIAAIFNEQKIPLPSVLARGQAKEKAVHSIAPQNEQVWLPATVWRILRRYEYTGALVMGKYRKMNGGRQTKRMLPRENWVITEGAHEAIVTHEEFWEAQSAIRSVSGKREVGQRNYLLKSKVRCGTCKRCMEYEIRGASGSYVCRYKRSSGKFSGCHGGVYSEAMVNAKVGEAVRKMSKIVIIVCDMLQEKREKEEDQVGAIRKLELELHRLRTERICCYEAYVAGRMNKTTYLTHRRGLTERMQGIEERLRQAEQWRKHDGMAEECLREMRRWAKEFEASGMLTKELADVFVKDVYLYDEAHMDVVFQKEEVLRMAVEQCAPEELVKKQDQILQNH